MGLSWVDSLFFWRGLLSVERIRLCGAVCFLAAAALMAAAIATGFPFALVLLGMCVSTFMGLREEQRALAAAA